MAKLHEVTEATAEVVEDLDFLGSDMCDAIDRVGEPFKVGTGLLAGRKVLATCAKLSSRTSFNEVLGDVWTIAKSVSKMPNMLDILLRYASFSTISITDSFVYPLKTFQALTTTVSAYELQQKVEVIWNFEKYTVLTKEKKAPGKLLEMKQAISHLKKMHDTLCDVKLISKEESVMKEIQDIERRLRSKKPKVRALAVDDGKNLIDRLDQKIHTGRRREYIDMASRVALSASGLCSMLLPKASFPFALFDLGCGMIQLTNYLYGRD